MEKLMCICDNMAIPKAMCSFEGEKPNSMKCDCGEVCKQYSEKGCKGCPIDEVFVRLALYEATGLSPKQIEDIDNLYAEKCREVVVLQESTLSGMELVRVWNALQVNKQYERARSEGRLHIAPLADGADIWKIAVNPDTGEKEVQKDSYLHGMTEYTVGKYDEDFFGTELEAKIALRIDTNPCKS